MSDRFGLIKTAFMKLEEAVRFDPAFLNETLRPVAQEYGILLIKADILLKKNVTHTFIIYSDTYNKETDFEGSTVFSCSSASTEGQRVTVTILVRKSVVLTQEQRDDMNFICRASCTLCEKQMLKDISEKFYYFDTVTGLHNINGLFRFANGLKGRGVLGDYSAAFINVVGFNYINKKAGYKVGTKLIKQYGLKMRLLLEKQELVARLGGDNFVLLFKTKNTKRILNAFDGVTVRGRVNSGDMYFNLSARAGVYDIPSNDVAFDIVMNYISTTLNYVKSYSRSNVAFYSQTIEDKVIEYKRFVQRFQGGIDNKEFFVVFQPKVHTDDNALYGGEALVRWKHNDVVYYPGDFIEVLEREHLISKLDFYVLEDTCRSMKKWIDDGVAPVKISINFSNDHLWDDTLVEDIVAIVDKYGIDHHLIEIEMTETADINEIAKLLSYVEGLHKNGFTVAIDDFGVGYSSLQVLQSVNVDVLKIDKSFVNDLSDDRSTRESIILKNIIGLARDLGIEIVAEGVETDDQRANLKEMNCNRIQGYVYDKPLSAEEFEQRLKQGIYEQV